MALDRLPIRCTGARVGFLAVVLAITGVTLGLRPAWAATITVTGTGDTVAVDGAVTLREAVTSINNGANVNADVVAIGPYGTNDTIVFNLTLPALITLTSNTPLTITNDVSIVGPTTGVVAVDGNTATQVFSNPGNTVTIENLTIQNGNVTGVGGGIYNNGTMTLTNCILDHNTASTDGGGFYNDGSGMATLTDCTLSNNTATTGVGGGFFHNGLDATSLTDCTLSGNTASAGDGGGLWSNAGITVAGSTFSGNKAPAGNGGGFFNGNPATVTNSTFSGNSAILGGGLDNGFPATVANCTFSGNSATSFGGGIFNSVDALNLINTIVANSTSGLDCFNNGTVNSDHNLIETDSPSPNQCSNGMNGDIVGPDPLLAPLGNYGGPTQTFALCEGPGVPAPSCTGRSPAIDAGNDAVTGPPLNLITDQRGLPRLVGLHVDIGSDEAQPQLFGHAAPALSTIGMAILAALLGAFGWWRPRTRRTPLLTP